MSKEKLFYLFFTFLLLTSCEKQHLITSLPGTLVEAVNEMYFSKSDCIQLVDSIDIKGIAIYDVRVYKLVYVSEYEGRPIETADMLFMPVDKGADYVDYNHGTIVC